MTSRSLFRTLAFAAVVLAPFALTPTHAEPPATPPAPPVPGPIPAKELFKNAAFRTPLINPAGTRMAAIFDTDQDQTGLMVIDLQTKKVERLLGSPGRDTDSIEWLGNEKIMTSQSREKIYSDGLFVVDAKNPRNNHPVLVNSATFFIGAPVDKPLEPFVWIAKDAYNNGEDYGPVQLEANVNVNPERGGFAAGTPGETDLNDFIDAHGTGAAIALKAPALKDGIPMRYAADRNGRLAFAISNKGGKNYLFYLVGDKWVQSPVDLDVYGFVGPGDVDGEIIVNGTNETGKPSALLRMYASTGDMTGVLYQDSTYDPDDAVLYRHPTTRKIIGISLVRAFHENVWFDPAMQEAQKQIAAALPATAINVFGYNNDLTKVVFAAYSDKIPVIYLRWEKDSGKLVSIALTRPGLEKVVMQPMQVIKYKTRDGFRTEAFLTLPAGASKQNPAPLIVLPHGGPHARDAWGWNPEAQFFASRGYAVFSPNYRGSDSYRWQYPNRDQWDFRKMHNDVTDGVKKLIQTGLVDPKRIAIAGTSFGGFLAVAGVAWEPDLYRCSISVAGVCDWRELVLNHKFDRYSDARYDMLVRFLGDPKTEAEAYREISPIYQVANIKVPVLVAHGKEDRVVDVEQSKLLVAELERHHVPHRKFFRRDEGHGMYKLDNQIELYTEMENFLAENMK